MSVVESDIDLPPIGLRLEDGEHDVLEEQRELFLLGEDESLLHLVFDHPFDVGVVERHGPAHHDVEDDPQAPHIIGFTCEYNI